MDVNKTVGAIGAMIAGSILALGALVATTAILEVLNPGTGEDKNDDPGKDGDEPVQ